MIVNGVSETNMKVVLDEDSTSSDGDDTDDAMSKAGSTNKQEVGHTSTRPTQVARLHSSDILACLDARLHLSAAKARVLLNVSNLSPPRKDELGHDWPSCKKAAQLLRRDTLGGVYCLVLYDVLAKEDYDDYDFCDDCIEFYEKSTIEQQQKFLDDLGECIRVDS